MSNNRVRILSEVLSLDAWHEPFKIDGETSGVFVELSFREGRIGGDDTRFPFTFKVVLRKALLKISCESPLRIDRHSISRDLPQVQIDLIKMRAVKERNEVSAGASGKLGNQGVAISLSGKADLASNNVSEDTMTKKQTVSEIIVDPIPINEHSYSWAMQPSVATELKGQPWDPIKSPRLSVRGLSVLGKIDPSIKITVSCALDDIIIDEIVFKKSSIQNSIKSEIFPAINQAAAVQHLKKVLIDADLEPSALDDRFSEILLANVLACVE
jgi:hypothetical protein